jgi:hypothetical protein
VKPAETLGRRPGRQSDDPATTDVFIQPGKYHKNLFSENYDDNLFSEDYDNNLFSEDYYKNLYSED